MVDKPPKWNRFKEEAARDLALHTIECPRCGSKSGVMCVATRVKGHAKVLHNMHAERLEPARAIHQDQLDQKVKGQQRKGITVVRGKVVTKPPSGKYQAGRPKDRGKSFLG